MQSFCTHCYLGLRLDFVSSHERKKPIKKPLRHNGSNSVCVKTTKWWTSVWIYKSFTLNESTVKLRTWNCKIRRIQIKVIMNCKWNILRTAWELQVPNRDANLRWVYSQSSHCSTGAGGIQLSFPQSKKPLQITGAYFSAPLAADLALAAPLLLIQGAGRDRMLALWATMTVWR